MAPLNRLLILASDAEHYRELLQAEQLPDLQVRAWSDPERRPDDIDRYNLILGEPIRVAPALDQAHQLEWVQSNCAGVEALCTPNQPRGYLLTGVKEVFGPFMADYVMAHILSLEMNLEGIREDQQTRVWGHRHDYRGLGHLTLGICGLGSIGRCIARTAAQFGMTVIAYKRTPEEFPPVQRIYRGEELEVFLKQVDYLVLVLPNTEATTHLINSRTLGMMKSSAVLINIGRGNAVNEGELIQALRNGSIRGAVLDVFKKEPLPKESPLWDLPGVVITPHNAGVSFPEDIVPIFMENYRRFQKGQTLKYVIDLERGY